MKKISKPMPGVTTAQTDAGALILPHRSTPASLISVGDTASRCSGLFATAASI